MSHSEASDLLSGFKDFCKSAVKTLLELSSKAPQAGRVWLVVFSSVGSIKDLENVAAWFCFSLVAAFPKGICDVHSFCLLKALQKDNQAFLMMCKKGATSPRLI
jgi:hypothetical protein